MKKLRHPIPVMILLWVCIAILLIVGNVLIYRIVNETNQTRSFPYTSMLVSYFIHPGMPQDVAEFILGGQGVCATSGLMTSTYSIFGGGEVSLLINSQNNTVEKVARKGELACWLFYAFMLSLAIAEVLLYRHLLKKGYFLQAQETIVQKC